MIPLSFSIFPIAGPNDHHPYSHYPQNQTNLISILESSSSRNLQNQTDQPPMDLQLKIVIVLLGTATMVKSMAKPTV